VEDVPEGRWDGGKRGVSLFFPSLLLIVPFDEFPLWSPRIVSLSAYVFFES